MNGTSFYFILTHFPQNYAQGQSSITSCVQLIMLPGLFKRSVLEYCQLKIASSLLTRSVIGGAKNVGIFIHHFTSSCIMRLFELYKSSSLVVQILRNQ